MSHEAALFIEESSISEASNATFQKVRKFGYVEFVVSIFVNLLNLMKQHEGESVSDFLAAIDLHV